jgi:hypothetical protein
MAWNDGIGIGGASGIVGVRDIGISISSGTHDNSLASLLNIDFISQSALKVNIQLRIIIINIK